MTHILIVDDEPSIRETLKEILEHEGYKITIASDGVNALDIIKVADQIDLVLSDVKMPRMDGVELLTILRQEGIEIPFVMISAHGTIETAVEATKKGAYDFIQKPPDLNRLLITIRNALESATLRKETKILKTQIFKRNQIIGDSPQIKALLDEIKKVASTEARVLILGENGTGKELVARAIHENSTRKNSPLIEVNCAAIPSELIESELFGHEKGAFTSAVKQKIGKFESADGGTLFLDEIGDMSLSAQAKVLRALQEQTISRVGGEKSLRVNVRVLAATNKDLRKEISEGRFREDLYHRLSVIILEVPPLRERKGDIALLTEYFINQICEEYKIKSKKIDDESVNFLSRRTWTGNIRELRNAIERLIIMSDLDITIQTTQKYVKE